MYFCILAIGNKVWGNPYNFYRTFNKQIFNFSSLHCGTQWRGLGTFYSIKLCKRSEILLFYSSNIKFLLNIIVYDLANEVIISRRRVMFGERGHAVHRWTFWCKQVLSTSQGRSCFDALSWKTKHPGQGNFSCIM